MNELSWPDSVSIAGVRGGSGDRVLAWARQPARLVVWSPSGRRDVKLPRNIQTTISAEFIGGRDLELVALRGGGVFRFVLNDSGRVLTKHAISVPVVPSEAQRVDGVWYVAGVDGDSAFQVFRLNRSDSAVHVVRIPRNSDTYLAAYGKLSSRGSDLIVTRVGFPYTVWRISAHASEVLAEPLKDSAVVRALTARPEAMWLALGTVAVDSGVVQSLTDVRGDSRLFIVFGADGRVITVAPLAAPLGFVDSDLQSRKLFAVRTLATREIVIYKWQWIRR